MWVAKGAFEIAMEAAPMNSHFVFTSAIAFTATLLAPERFASAQTASKDSTTSHSDKTATQPPDGFFPGRGRVSVSMAPGVPFVVIGEAAIGISDGFAVGLTGGVTDTLAESAI